MKNEVVVYIMHPLYQVLTGFIRHYIRSNSKPEVFDSNGSSTNVWEQFFASSFSALLVLVEQKIEKYLVFVYIPLNHIPACYIPPCYIDMSKKL